MVKITFLNFSGENAFQSSFSKFFFKVLFQSSFYFNFVQTLKRFGHPAIEKQAF
jgi:hypothetical protein